MLLQDKKKDKKKKDKKKKDKKKSCSDSEGSSDSESDDAAEVLLGGAGVGCSVLGALCSV